MWKKRLAAAFATSIAAAPALACAFHSYAPQPTLVDRLLGSEHVVLARTADESPFRYTAVEALEGELTGVEIPHLVDSVTRRKLAGDPEDMVLFARDEAYGPWVRLAYVDNGFEPILNDVLARLPTWEFGADEDRFAYFAQHLNHPDPVIRRLALRELDQADYATLRGMSLDIDGAKISEVLDSRTEVDLKAIRILLLGLNGDPSHVPLLKARLKSNILLSSPYLGAYATALIESTGQQGIDWLAKNILPDATLSQDARESLIEAMAIHSTLGDPVLRASVSAVVENALHTDAQLAPAVARQFGIRADWSHRATLASMLREGALTSPFDIITVSQYVALAEETQ